MTQDHFQVSDHIEEVYFVHNCHNLMNFQTFPKNDGTSAVFSTYAQYFESYLQEYVIP